MDEFERARSALYALDPGCAREAWVLILMAAKSAGLSLDEVTDWSSSAANFDGERDCKQVWRSITDGPVKAGTLFSRAFAVGWKDPAKGRKNGHSTRHTLTRVAAPTRMRIPLKMTGVSD